MIRNGSDASGPPAVFWGELAPCEHLVQIFDSDDACLDALEGFVRGGIRIGDGVIVIATKAHLEALEQRLASMGLDLEIARSLDQYIAVDADLVLSRFMVDGWPDSDRFMKAIVALVTQARRGGRRVRAFGEMVALLWGRGQTAATIRLEHLWNQLCAAERCSLFCAYPKLGFTKDSTDSIRQICELHTKVVTA